MSRAAGWYWPWLITAALLFTVGVNVVMLVAANGNGNGVVVEQDYYRKAVDWDRTMERRAASDALGWVARVELRAAGQAPARLVVDLRDGTGAAITGAIVSATLIHNLAAATPIRAVLSTVAEGRYVADGLALRHPGQWEIRLEASRDGARFTEVVRVELLPPDASIGGGEK